MTSASNAKLKEEQKEHTDSLLIENASNFHKHTRNFLFVKTHMKVTAMW